MSASKYKVGDKVVVKNIGWYNANKDARGDVRVPCLFTSEMSRFCSTVLTIKRVRWDCYLVESNGYSWSDEMLQGYARNVCKYDETKNLEDLPKDFASCAAILGIDDADAVVNDLERLIMCRDLYWQLADNWFPNWKENTKKHCIVARYGKVRVATAIYQQRDFAFPTPQMADMFAKNFKADLGKL